jgi:dihydrodipicolinate synthase/N-acetylneuraminate lyase
MQCHYLQAAHAESLGSDGLLCLPELFNKPQTVDELVKYLTYVGQAAPKTPLLYYHIPSYTGVKGRYHIQEEVAKTIWPICDIIIH